MLARSAPLPTGSGWSFEPKWDGFRALVSTVDGLRVRSRRGWDMTDVVPELGELPAGLLLDGELVAWRGKDPYFPAVGRRVLNGDRSIPLTYVVFDLLAHDGADLMEPPYSERRSRLESLDLEGRAWTTTPVFDDGAALFAAICEQGLEGVVAKRRSSRYRPGDRGHWIKQKNPNYWRRESEIEAMRRSFERRKGRGRGIHA
jgi:bifunctional non-homologous end joining protein LigD